MDIDDDLYYAHAEALCYATFRDDPDHQGPDDAPYRAYFQGRIDVLSARTGLTQEHTVVPLQLNNAHAEHFENSIGANSKLRPMPGYTAPLDDEEEVDDDA